MTKHICPQQKICKKKLVNKFVFRRMAKRHKPGRKWPDNAIQEENWKRRQVSIILISKLENEGNEHKNIWKMAIPIHRGFLIVIWLKVCKHSAGLVRLHGKLHQTKQCHRDIWGGIFQLCFMLSLSHNSTNRRLNPSLSDSVRGLVLWHRWYQFNLCNV